MVIALSKPAIESLHAHGKERLTPTGSSTYELRSEKMKDTLRLSRSSLVISSLSALNESLTECRKGSNGLPKAAG